MHPIIQKLHDNYSHSFDYSETTFVNSKIKLKIKCKKCGEFFNQRIDKHREGQQGDCMCRPTNKRKDYVNHREENQNKLFIKKAMELKNNKSEYNYSNTHIFRKINKANNSELWANIKCNRCNKEFEQRNSNHLAGQGCSICNQQKTVYKKQKYKNRFTILYFIKINNLYKIGVTMSSVNTRYSRERNNPIIKNIDIIKTWSFENGEEAFLLEQTILNKFKYIKYCGPNILRAGGNGELITENILSQITAQINLSGCSSIIE